MWGVLGLFAFKPILPLEAVFGRYAAHIGFPKRRPSPLNSGLRPEPEFLARIRQARIYGHLRSIDVGDMAEGHRQTTRDLPFADQLLLHP
jgi:hypothetical protein